MTDAIWVVLGEYHARDHVNGLNVGTYLPVALPIWLFGKSEIALSVWPLLCSLLGVVSLAGACTILFGRGFGVLAALLYVTYPGDVFFSTVVMPDSIQAGWLSFAMLLIVVSFAGPVDQRRWKLVAAGVALGICHLIRANDVILVPVGVAAVGILSWLWKRETDRRGVARLSHPSLRLGPGRRARGSGVSLGRTRFLSSLPRRQPPLRSDRLDRAVGIEYGREHDPVQHLPASDVVAHG